MPGTPWATPPAELEKLAGYGHDINASRAEAKRLLREAGIPDGFAFTFKNRGIPQPYEPVGIWLIDQWRQIGLNVKQETIEASAYHPMLKRGDFDVAMDFQCSYVIEPDIDIEKFQSAGVSDRNFGRYKDPVLDDLFVKQARSLDPRSGSVTSARSRSGCSTRKCTTCTRSSSTASSPTAARCGAGRSRRRTSSTSSSTPSGWRSSPGAGCPPGTAGYSRSRGRRHTAVKAASLSRADSRSSARASRKSESRLERAMVQPVTAVVATVPSTK